MAEHTLEIESLNADGDGVARLARRLIVVPFTIPGERVRVRLEPARVGAKREESATLLEVIRASPHRVVPRCPHFDRVDRAAAPCGGCAWQHIDYREQLRLKTAAVDRLIRAAVPSAPATLRTIPSTAIESPWGFRSKAHFVFGPGRGRDSVTMGHYARDSRAVVPVLECPVHAEAGNQAAFALRDAYVRAGITAVDPRGNRLSPRGAGRPSLKSVAVRVARNTSEVMTTVVVSGEGDPRLRSATRAAMKGAPETALHVNIHPRADKFIFGRDTRRVSGPARLRESIAGVTFLISPTAFFQTNIAAAEVLVRLVLEAVPADARVLDLYAGAGLFALALASRGQTVVAVEANRAAVADGEVSRDFNGIPAGRCRFIAMSVERAPDRLRADAVVMDPPREGCAPRVLRRVCTELGPRLVAYVSCNPEALARDLRVMTQAGYRIDSIQPVDMFPHTAHIETLAVLARGSAGSRR
jgi:23S rRNA (uracil1939-C5)-methyltransferase